METKEQQQSQQPKKRKDTDVIADLSELAEPFAEDAIMMVQALADEHMPIRVFETRRTAARQDHLFIKGVTRAGGLASPHAWGLAIDMILDLDHDHWKRKKEHPKGGPWDSGVDFDGKTCTIARPEVVRVWKRYGELAKNLGFVWGGLNEGPWKSARDGDVFGWDIAHVQMAKWRIVAGKMTPPTK